MLGHLKRLCYAAVTVGFILLAIEAAGRQRGQSTAEERTRAVQVARSLRADPVSPVIQSDREWLMKWIIAIPDISVSLCGGLLGDLGDSKTGYPGALLATMLASEVAFVIENPGRAKDKDAIYLAGLEGALDGYQVIHSRDANYRLPQMDDLLTKRTEGKLPDYMRTATKKCK